jgi:UDP-glucose 4-epimerase
MCRSAGDAWGLKWAALRYFNVAGAASPALGDPAVLNLIPLILQAVCSGQRPKIFGADHPTADGTCLRDYVHVQDLAEAHVMVLDHLRSSNFGPHSHRVFNVGTGCGSSVRDVLDKVAQVIGRDTDAEVVGRRLGDPPMLVADSSRIASVLGWTAQRDLTDMVESAWEAWPSTHGPCSAIV